MEDLTFGEQIKIILGRKGMTIKQLAEQIEIRTGKKMSRQNLTQRLGRDNFQEQDMRMIAEILDCPFHLSILSEIPAQPHSNSTASVEAAPARRDAPENTQTKRAGEERGYQEHQAAEEEDRVEERDMTIEERDMTIGELYEIHRELSELEENARAGEPVEEIKKELKEKVEKTPGEEDGTVRIQTVGTEGGAAGAPGEDSPAPVDAGGDKNRRDRAEDDFEPVISYHDAEEDRENGEVNPYTGREYQSNSVRMHPTRIGYVQVYDRTIHKWTDMTEWAFLGLQERKKALLGKSYEPPIYLD